MSTKWLTAFPTREELSKRKAEKGADAPQRRRQLELVEKGLDYLQSEGLRSDGKFGRTARLGELLPMIFGAIAEVREKDK